MYVCVCVCVCVCVGILKQSVKLYVRNRGYRDLELELNKFRDVVNATAEK